MISLIPLGAFVAGLLLAYAILVRPLQAQNKDLHNRLMSRNFGDFATFNSLTVPENPTPSRMIVTDATGLIEAEDFE